jgi:hypothetical protein
MKVETETLDDGIVQDDLVQPMTLEQRKARGFCTCPLKAPAGVETTPDHEPCRVHPKHLIDCAEYNQSRGLLFFDDRRNRYVTWEDSVEAMRQPRYAGATSRGLLLYTWMNLIRLLEALCYPTREPVAEVTEAWAGRLIRLAGQNFPPDGLASLMVVARGGDTEALCTVFRALARNAEAGHAECHTAFTLISTVAANHSAVA